jgi:hypothetical protein
MDAWLFVFPVGLHFDRSQSMFRSLSEPLFLLTIVMGAALVYVAWIKRQQISAWMWFLMGWFALEMLPVSQIVTTIGVGPGVISCADHFLYLASIPVLIGMVQGFSKGWQLNKEYRWSSEHVLKGSVGVILVFWIIMNVQQNMYANSERDLFEHSLRIQPNNARAHSSLGLIYAQNKEFVKAQEHFAAAVQGDFLNPRYRISLAQSVCDQGRYKECLDLYNEIEEVGKYGQLLKQNKEAAQRLIDQHAQILSK